MVGRDDDRAVSEAMGVTILVGFTLLVVVSVGVSVLFIQDDSSARPSANFSFDYRSANSILLVTHERGETLPAGELVLEGDSNEVSWAAVASISDDETVGPGDLIQLSANSAWGEAVRQGDRVDIYHEPPDGNRTLLDSWSD